jgi:hypothetical protein
MYLGLLVVYIPCFILCQELSGASHFVLAIDLISDTAQLLFRYFCVLYRVTLYFNGNLLIPPCRLIWLLSFLFWHKVRGYI